MIDAALKANTAALAFAEEAQGLNEHREVIRRFRHVVGDFGFERVTFGGLPVGEERFEDLVLTQDLPREWLDLYYRQRYDRVDPVLHWARRLVWPFESRDADNSDLVAHLTAQSVVDGRREFGLSEGFIVPVPRPTGLGFVWMSGMTPDLSLRSKALLHLMALYAFDRIMGLVSSAARRARRVTEREREVLAWIAAGKSSWEIGEILGIAKRTVDEHAKSAARKLGAVNRTQAVAIALRERLIDL